VAKFHGDQQRELGDVAKKIKKEKTSAVKYIGLSELTFQAA